MLINKFSVQIFSIIITQAIFTIPLSYLNLILFFGFFVLLLNNGGWLKNWKLQNPTYRKTIEVFYPNDKCRCAADFGCIDDLDRV